jgi:hypothetical protein
MVAVLAPCGPEGIHEDPWMTNQGDVELTYVDTLINRRETALQRTNDEIARLRQKPGELEPDARSGNDPEYHDAQRSHFRAGVLAHASPAPKPLTSEEF